jgi:ABC-type transport system substrate-binding protein
LRNDLPWFRYDPEQASQILSRSKLQFRLLVPPDAVFERLALEIKRQLYSVGVAVVVDQVSVDRLLEAIKTRDFDAILMEGLSGPTLFRPYQFWHSEGAMNPGHLGNSSVDVALDRLRTAASDDEFRTAAAAAQAAFMDDPPAVFLAWSQVARAVSNRFHVATDPNRPDVLGTMRLWTPAAAERPASRN